MVTCCAPADTPTPEEVRQATARRGDLGALRPVLDLTPELATLPCTFGARHATLMALHGRTAIPECRIPLQQGDAFDLQVTASPFTRQGEEYALMLLGDISS